MSGDKAVIEGDQRDPLVDLVGRFSAALLDKLRAAEAKGRSGWNHDDWEDQCRDSLIKHLEKGDHRDVAAYLAFMWHHDWPLARVKRDSDDAVAALRPSPAIGDAQAPGKPVSFLDAMNIVERGFDTWKNKPHNAKWYSRIDGTPIPNDLKVNIAEAICHSALSSKERAK